MISAKDPAAAADSNHDARGRFTRGNRGGPGNPFAHRVADLRAAFLDALTPEDMRAVALALLLKARSGDLTAAKLLLQYSLGKPVANVPERRTDSTPPCEESTDLLDEIASLLQSEPLVPATVVTPPDPPRPLNKAERKAMYREMRKQRRGPSPSANGSNGR